MGAMHGTIWGTYKVKEKTNKPREERTHTKTENSEIKAHADKGEIEQREEIKREREKREEMR